jgi:hypothetical protein
MAVRCPIQPVTLNAQALAATMSTFPIAGATVGIDAAGTGGTAFATTWGTGPYAGVEFVNNGSMFLYVYNGATASVAYHLIGQKAAGQAELYSTLSTTIPATSGGWIGPWSVQQFTQTDASQFLTLPGGVSPGGQIGLSTPSGVGYTCIDFLPTTTLSVRLYQLVPAIP